MRPLVLGALALSSILLAGSAAADEPPSPPPAAPPAAVAPPPRYYPPPPPYYGPTYAYGRPVRETRERYSTPMMIAGIALSAVGSIALGIGTTMYLINDSVVCVSDGFGGGSSCGPSHGGDTAVMVIGGIASLAGIPLIAVGAHSVPIKPGEAALIPRLSVSPRGASLAFSF